MRVLALSLALSEANEVEGIPCRGTRRGRSDTADDKK